MFVLITVNRRVLVLALILAAPAPGLAANEQARAFSVEDAPRILRFAQVDERLFRGGQPALADFARLRALGIDTVVSFRMEDDERATVEALGMRFVHLPVSMKPFGLSGAVSAETVASFFEVVDDPASGKVFVHCRHGKDRTGLFVSLYRVNRQGWKAEDAYREARGIGMSWWHFPVKGTIEKFANDNE